MILRTRPVYKNFCRLKDSLYKASKLAWAEVDDFILKRLILTICLLLGVSLLLALAPLALKLAIDALTSNQWITLDLTPLSIDNTVPLGPALLLLLYIFCLWGGRSLSELREYIFGTADQRLHRRLSRHLFSHIMMLPMAFHLDRKTGALNQILGQGLAGYSLMLNHMVFNILPIAIELIIIMTIMASLFKPVFLIILGLTTFAYGAAFTLGMSRISGPIQNVADAQIKTFSALTDSLLNYETIKYFTAEQPVNDKYDCYLAKSERQWAIFLGRKSMNGLLIAGIFALSLGSSIIIASEEVRQGHMTIGGFILINSYMLQIIRPLEILGGAFRDMTQATAFIDKMMIILNQKTEDHLTGPKRSLCHIMPIFQNNSEKQEKTLPLAKGSVNQRDHLEFNRVTFSYETPSPSRHHALAPIINPVLKEISFTVKEGKTLAIVGKSGAGKSSLIRLLTRLYDPDLGEIYFKGQSIEDIPLALLRKTIAIVPQDVILFNDSIASNIAFGKRGCSMEDIKRAAGLAHIHDFIINSPEGYQTQVGERGLKLSGGEKQRISLARAILKDPQIFVFDEATSSLDAATEQDILRNLINISKGVTSLIITHRLSTIIQADQILVLDQGAIIERGTHHSLMMKNGHYAHMWRSQQPR